MTNTITRCGSCDAEGLESVLFLGWTPPACSMRPVGDRSPDTHYPLELLRCPDCKLVQLSCIVDPKTVFHRAYPYATGNTQALRDHFAELARSLTEYVEPGDLIVDIGANDGTLLREFPDQRCVAVDPTDQVKHAASEHIWPVQGFFGSFIAGQVLNGWGPAKLVTACNVLAHVEDIHDVLDGVHALLHPSGAFVIENHDLASVTGGQWDTVYHEHLRYYDRGSFSRLLAAHGFGVVGCEPVGSHGGSFRVTARKMPGGVQVLSGGEYDWPHVRRKAGEARRAIRHTVNSMRGGHRVFAIGASARAVTLLNYCGLTAEDITCVCEVEGSDKIGHYIPGTTIPVVDEQVLLDEQPEAALLLAWQWADSITRKLRSSGYRGTIIRPLPTVAVSTLSYPEFTPWP